MGEYWCSRQVNVLIPGRLSENSLYTIFITTWIIIKDLFEETKRSQYTKTMQAYHIKNKSNERLKRYNVRLRWNHGTNTIKRTIWSVWTTWNNKYIHKYCHWGVGSWNVVYYNNKYYNHMIYEAWNNKETTCQTTCAPVSVMDTNSNARTTNRSFSIISWNFSNSSRGKECSVNIHLSKSKIDKGAQTFFWRSAFGPITFFTRIIKVMY